MGRSRGIPLRGSVNSEPTIGEPPLANDRVKAEETAAAILASDGSCYPYSGAAIFHDAHVLATAAVCFEFELLRFDRRPADQALPRRCVVITAVSNCTG